MDWNESQKPYYLPKTRSILLRVDNNVKRQICKHLTSKIDVVACLESVKLKPHGSRWQLKVFNHYKLKFHLICAYTM